MAQSALSQQPQRLEREPGVLLLHRTTHHVELTPSGSAFLIEARRILAQVDRAALAASPEVPVAKPAAQLAASRGSCRGVVGAA